MGIVQHAVISQAAILSDLKGYININTLFGVVVVLAVLLLIALVYLANIMSFLKNTSSDNVESQKSTVDNTVAQSTGNTQEELVGNNELVAAITAALHEYIGNDVPANGFVVRSIRRAR